MRFGSTRKARAKLVQNLKVSETCWDEEQSEGGLSTDTTCSVSRVWVEMVANLPVADLGTAADREFLHHTAQDMCKGQEREYAVVTSDLDLLLVHVRMQGGHSSDDILMREHHTLGVACGNKQELAELAQTLACKL